MVETLEFRPSFPIRAAGNLTETCEAKYVPAFSDLLTTNSIMLILSVVPIVSGSFHSARNRDRADKLSTKEAMMAPLVLSCILFGLYACIQLLGTEKLDVLVTFVIPVAGAYVLFEIASFILRLLVPEHFIENERYGLTVRRALTKTSVINVSFDHYDILGAVLAAMFAGWYLMEKDWIASNLFGIAFAHFGIANVHLNSVRTACILLCGLIIYDVVWVFGTDVMESVALDIDAPMKLAIPWNEHIAMIGLGDIVLPGLLIALLFRYDLSKGSDSRLYSSLSLAAYVVASVVTSVIAVLFESSQPALLFIVPPCIGVPVLVALVRGEIKLLSRYRDTPEFREEQPSIPAGRVSQARPIASARRRRVTEPTNMRVLLESGRSPRNI